jgi:hypothetical protein
MLQLRKIPLQPLIEILQDLWDSGADFIDLAGEQGKEGAPLKDTIQITVKPEYMNNDDNELPIEEQRVDIEFYEDDDDEYQYDENDEYNIIDKPLSEDDINELI